MHESNNVFNLTISSKILKKELLVGRFVRLATQKKFLDPYLHFDNMLQDQHNGLCKLVGLVRLVKRRHVDEQSPA